MTAEADILNRLARIEALLSRLTGADAPVVVQPPPPLLPDPSALEIPFLMSERELVQYERFVAEDERPILRQRVYAARAASMGHRETAAKLRRKADRMEMQLEAGRKAA